MAHARKQIRDLIVTAISGNPGVTAVASRAYPTTEDQMPIYLVYANGEAMDEAMSTRQGLMRVLNLSVEAVVAQIAGDAEIDDLLDAHGVYLETQLSNSTLGGAVLKTVLRRSELDNRLDGEISVGVLTLTFDVTYRTLPTNPETLA